MLIAATLAASDFKWNYDAGSGILSPVALPKTGPAHIKGTISGRHLGCLIVDAKAHPNIQAYLA